MTKTRNGQRVKQYDFDHEIICAIQNNKHKFNEIRTAIKFKGSFSTLSNHLAQLVKLEYIEKKIVNNKPRYYLATASHWLSDDKGLMGILNKKISTIAEASKKIPDKELLKEFVDDTKDLLIILSQINFSNISILNDMKESERQDKPNIILGLNEKYTELINKLIIMRINILEKRDKEYEEEQERLEAEGQELKEPLRQRQARYELEVGHEHLSILFTKLIMNNLQNQLSKN